MLPPAPSAHGIANTCGGVTDAAMNETASFPNHSRTWNGQQHPPLKSERRCLINCFPAYMHSEFVVLKNDPFPCRHLCGSRAADLVLTLININSLQVMSPYLIVRAHVQWRRHDGTAMCMVYLSECLVALWPHARLRDHRWWQQFRERRHDAHDTWMTCK